MKLHEGSNKDYTHAYSAADFADYGVRYNILTNKTYCSHCGKELIQPKPTEEHPYPRRFCSVACAYRYFQVDKRAPHDFWVEESYWTFHKLWNEIEESYNADLERFTAGSLHRYIVREKDFGRIEDDFISFNWDTQRRLNKSEINKAINDITAYMHRFVGGADKLCIHEILALATITSRMWFFSYLEKSGALRVMNNKILRVTNGKSEK